jgi:hypothetical protein
MYVPELDIQNTFISHYINPPIDQLPVVFLYSYVSLNASVVPVNALIFPINGFESP